MHQQFMDFLQIPTRRSCMCQIHQELARATLDRKAGTMIGMPKLVVPNSVTLHNARAFLASNRPFADKSRRATLQLHPRWAHLDPMALSMIAAWGAWCRRNGYGVTVKNLGRHARYAARMKLFEHLGVDFDPHIAAREEAGRFLPVTQVANRGALTGVIGDVSALLHMDAEPDGLAAVQYCVSELIRNVLEHSGSPDGAFVCAHRYTKKKPHRVTIAVADCGQGVARHLGRAHPEALGDDAIALGLAMRPGVTGAIPGMYGTTDNAGAGLFITRSIAKGTGGYFLFYSGEQPTGCGGRRVQPSKSCCTSTRLTSRTETCGDSQHPGKEPWSWSKFAPTELLISKDSSNGFESRCRRALKLRGGLSSHESQGPSIGWYCGFR